MSGWPRHCPCRFAPLCFHGKRPPSIYMSGRFQKIAAWRAAYLPESDAVLPVAFYMFSGPDFMYVDQFFPNASVYVLCGTEPIGPAPDPLRLNDTASALQNLQNSMNSL